MKKIVITGLVGVVLSILIGGGAAWFVINAMQPSGSAAKLSLKKSVPENKNKHANDIFVSLKESVITLSDTQGEDHYMLLALTMVAESEEASKKIQADEPLYQSIILTTLADREYEKVRALKINEIKTMLNTALHRELKSRATPGPYSDILISKMVFQ